ncbi:MAG: hypothetical protein HC933_01845 [Pleurocapsa sp. SU_196_0]|nr:hypothetical protein [Pleurocapsa sp. SU_196_0]
MGKGIILGIVVLAFSVSASAVPGCTAERCLRGLRGDVRRVETVSLSRDLSTRQHLEFDTRGELTSTKLTEGRNVTTTEYRRDDRSSLLRGQSSARRCHRVAGTLRITDGKHVAGPRQSRHRALPVHPRRLNRVTRRTCTGDGLIHSESLEYDDTGFLARRRLSAMVGQFGMQTEALYAGGAEHTWSVAFVAPGNDRRAVFTYRYDRTDSNGNWLERSRLDEHGVAVESETREISYADVALR